MLIQIDPTSDLAIYEQIIRQVKFGIASGAVRPNELIPSVRELSKQLALNPNTVARAYRSLQREELVYARRGLGLAVDRQAPERCRRERIELIRERVRQVLQEARQSRLAVQEIEKLVGEELRNLPWEGEKASSREEFAEWGNFEKQERNEHHE